MSDYFYNCATTKKKGHYISLACLSAFLPIGHIFGFEGYRDPLTGALWFPAESTFDTLVTISNGAPYFDSLNAEEVFGI